MRFLLSAEQRQFAASLDELLRGVPAGTTPWAELAEMGVTALAVPERHNGIGAHPADLVVAFEQLGRHAVAGPLIESVVVVPVLLAELPIGETWLPKLAEGSATATLAMPPHVPWAVGADSADLVLLANADEVCTGRAGESLSSVDRYRLLFEIAPEAVVANDCARVIERGFRFGVLAGAAMLLGAGHAMLALATEYAGQRRQFGRPIGAFQAVKHRLADALVGLELARPLLYGAAIALAEDADTADRDTSAAKIACADAASRAGRGALQVHGAIGYTAEHPLGRYLTMVRALVSAWGTNSVHRATVLRELTCGSR